MCGNMCPYADPNGSCCQGGLNIPSDGWCMDEEDEDSEIVESEFDQVE